MKLTKSQLKEFIDEEFDQMDEAPGAADVRSEQKKAELAVMNLFSAPALQKLIKSLAKFTDWAVKDIDANNARMGEVGIDLQSPDGKSTRVTLTAKGSPKVKRNVPTDYSPESDLYKL